MQQVPRRSLHAVCGEQRVEQAAPITKNACAGLRHRRRSRDPPTACHEKNGGGPTPAFLTGHQPEHAFFRLAEPLFGANGLQRRSRDSGRAARTEDRGTASDSLRSLRPRKSRATCFSRAGSRHFARRHRDALTGNIPRVLAAQEHRERGDVFRRRHPLERRPLDHRARMRSTSMPRISACPFTMRSMRSPLTAPGAIAFTVML